MSAHDLQRDELFTLTERQCEGTLGADDAARLSALLIDSADHRRRYLEHVQLHGEMHWQTAGVSERLQRTAATTTARLNAPPLPRRFSPIALALAAAVLLAGLAVAIFFLSSNPKSEIRNPKSPSTPIATLIEATGDVIVNDNLANPGSEYASGAYSIESGSAELLLASKVGVQIRGKTRVVLQGPMNATMTLGEATFTVPPSAVGYTVHLPDGSRVIDLGTVFVTDIDDDGRQTLRVTEGVVELHHAGSVTTLPARHAARYADGRWRFVDTTALGIAEHSDTVDLLPFAPDSVEADALQSGSRLFVFHERTGVVIEPGDRAAITRPGQYTSSNAWGGDLPSGVVADSIFIHFDSPGDRHPPAVIDASITFDRPILGVVTGGGLPHVNQRFAGPDTRYSDDPDRGIDPGDTVTLSEDRRTLTVHLVSDTLDQLRVIVEAAPKSDLVDQGPRSTTPHSGETP